MDALVVRTLPLLPRRLVRRFAAPYIAGETLDDARVAVGRLNRDGMQATIDVLGEEISTLDEAAAIQRAYLGVLDAIAEDRLDADVSVKPTGLGIKLDRAHCRDLIAELATAAADRGTGVEIDMEDSSTTADTLAVARDLHESGHRNVGVVLQAMLYRTPADVDALADLRPRIRIVKGIYVESGEVAHTDFEAIRRAYLETLDRVLAIGAYPAVATHDQYLVDAAASRIRDAGLPRGGYEYQLLLGVRPGLAEQLHSAGHRVRLYVPYGERWYEYSVRRLRENPALAGSVARGTLRRLVGLKET
jgi:proline dehydrogenase